MKFHQITMNFIPCFVFNNIERKVLDKHQYPQHIALGGPAQEGYGQKYVTLLIHWNKSPGDTEKTAIELFEVLRQARDVTVNDETIKFIQPLYEIQNVGTTDAGIYEMVIEMAVIYEKKGKQNET